MDITRLSASAEFADGAELAAAAATMAAGNDLAADLEARATERGRRAVVSQAQRCSAILADEQWKVKTSDEAEIEAKLKSVLSLGVNLRQTQHVQSSADAGMRLSGVSRVARHARWSETISAVAHDE